MKNRYTGLLPKVHLWTDLLMFNLSFAVAYYIRFEIRVPDHLYTNLLLIGNLLWILTTYVFRTYQFNRISYIPYRQAIILLKACVIHVSVILGFLYFSQQGGAVSRTQFLLTYAIFVSCALVARALIWSFILFCRQAGYNMRTYAVIGKGEVAGLIEGFYNDRKELGYKKCGNYEVGEDKDEVAVLERFLQKTQPDFIYCCLSDMNELLVKGVIRFAQHQKAQVRLVPDFGGFINNLATIEYHDQYPIIQLNTKPFSGLQDETIKRAFDLIFSTLVMIFGAPIFVLLMGLVAMSSPGPVFFLQERSGRWGKIFKVIKFRTMYQDADKFGLKHSQGDHDPRITPLGRLLRRSRLDELPQFLNVFKGDMSIVGPRPLFRYDVDMLMQEVPQEFMTLLTVKPGITSIGQIKVGYASNIDENLERLRYDLNYLTKYSMVTDVMLIVQTIQVMLMGRGR
ncbi:exopolysaccharide biosynthesis polyprenyl glycosylphosphotransferase [Dyadobacter sp. CY107]|uniref:exopolysaccharide biosynthesis polyprenyl glycosylphosphotransferase n=1 Tax=Dyadobacter fanqingshengii TaxID=2906443 RepID=UPI001F392675|nr:exopolysaccharide biosynthesis polyprenyl glycosylphosphotransferase [Dyadobacter fanqingshengii]MCF2502636.1 exopolysaccharide biosynthesis polyprenyl glycosylphosphotransferase [Dyadobacter fanqingshengii]